MRIFLADALANRLCPCYPLTGALPPDNSRPPGSPFSEQSCFHPSFRALKTRQNARETRQDSLLHAGTFRVSAI